MKLCDEPIKVGARASLLSKIQVLEVENLIKKTHPEVSFACNWIETKGDKDRTTSLVDLENSDFFTQEIDQALLQEKVHICIHSAKDLPRPLPKGLKQIALTKGLTPLDSLVIPANKTMNTMPKKPRIGTSSTRRGDAVRKIFPDAEIIDIRGTIQERLNKLLVNALDGVVIAEAALIRLGLVHLNRIPLDGPFAFHQGQLAILAKEENLVMEQLFKNL